MEKLQQQINVMKEHLEVNAAMTIHHETWLKAHQQHIEAHEKWLIDMAVLQREIREDIRAITELLKGGGRLGGNGLKGE